MTTIGVVGGRWRALVTPWGAVVPGDGSPVLDWWVAADDRWHTPQDEPTLRQHRVQGAPVVETIIRVPGGDAIHRVYAVPDDGGVTVVEVENASSLPFAVALGRPDLLTTRPPTDVPVQGIELPEGTVVLPVGHRTTLRVGLPHLGDGPGPLPGWLPSADQVVRGWVTQTELGLLLDQPDVALGDGLVSARAALLLEGPDTHDPVAHVIGAAELVRLGEHAGQWSVMAAVAAQEAARQARSAGAGAGSAPSWDVLAAVDAAAAVLRRAGEPLGASDAVKMARALGPSGPLPSAAPADPARFVAWAVRRMVLPTPDGADLLVGWMAEWLGMPLAAHRVPVRGTTVSFAVRWHGDRPALLWEADEAMLLRCPMLDPTWSSSDAKGEALLAAPADTAGRVGREPVG